MTDQPQPPPPRKPKSLLETHQNEYALIKALNEYAASQQKQSTPSDEPGYSSQDQSQDNASVASSSTNPYRQPRQKEKPTMKEPGLLVSVPRRRLAICDQPTVSELLEIGVKVRDFAYESTLPPVPTVYLQPRQIQPSVPKDVNDPNDPHYVLEEERKKRVYTFQSTRKIARTPTEPLLESDILPPPVRTFPKIKRADAHLDLGSQFGSQPSSQPVPSHPTLPYDITNTPFSASQLVSGPSTDSQKPEPWVDTPVVTPNGSIQRPQNQTSTESTSPTPRQSTEAAPSTLPAIASETGPTRNAGSIAQSQSVDRQPQRSLSATHEPSLSTRPVTPGRFESPGWKAQTSLVATPPLESSPPRDSPRALDAVSPARSRCQSPSAPTSDPSKLTPSPELTSSSSSPHSPPRYNLRNKRRAESPPPISPGARPPSRSRSMRTRSASKAILTDSISVKSMHPQNKALPGAVSTGRTVKRPRDSGINIDDSSAGEIVSANVEATRRSKRRNKGS